jgi:electron transport complex protein RnfD
MPGKTEIKISEQNLMTAPHLKSGESVKLVMWTVAAALFPLVAFAGYVFGFHPVFVIAVSIVAAVTAETIMQILFKKPLSASDGSAFVTGLLVALNLPSDAPIWVSAAGSVFAVIIIKQLFGGLGSNIFNPALSARAVIMLFWSVFMPSKLFQLDGLSNYRTGFSSYELARPVLDSVKEGSRLVIEKNISIEKLNDAMFSFKMIKSFLFENTGGGIGEISLVLILIGGIFLIARKIISWHIPVVYIGTVGIVSCVFYILSGNPYAQFNSISQVFSGGLFLGAFFMATDPVTTPVTGSGKLIFAAGCGILTFFIRFYGSYPYGVCIAVLIMNAFVPLIDRFVRPKVFGYVKNK